MEIIYLIKCVVPYQVLRHVFGCDFLPPWVAVIPPPSHERELSTRQYSLQSPTR